MEIPGGRRRYFHQKHTYYTSMHVSSTNYLHEREGRRTCGACQAENACPGLDPGCP